jgi:Effector Associated Constant Component 1
MLQLELRSGGDRLRLERLTRELLDHLNGDPDVTHAGLTVTPSPPAPPNAGSKGVVDTAVVLLVAGAPYAQPAADALSTAIQSWCQRDPRHVVRITDGDRSVEVVGNPTRAQRDLIEQFVRGDEEA